MPTLASIEKDIDAHLLQYSSEENANHRFAFWHDVGVTGLGALATVLLGVAEISSDFNAKQRTRSVAALLLILACLIGLTVYCVLRLGK